ncbi:MAG: hypothetical protein LBR22_10690 [Desulfovibrio sp.]|jgi:hypothetical protein|nr:hypothetical protein [Desulfovibrio sp.]
MHRTRTLRGAAAVLLSVVLGLGATATFDPGPAPADAAERKSAAAADRKTDGAVVKKTGRGRIAPETLDKDDVLKRRKPSARKASPDKARKPAPAAPAPAATNVYDGQPPVTEKELGAFLQTLPAFRVWARENREEAGPVDAGGKPDFQYSAAAGQWVKDHGWDPRRFFCVMGRMAAALVIVEEGNDMGRNRPRDMPEVRDEELDLTRRNIGSILKVVNTIDH